MLAAGLCCKVIKLLPCAADEVEEEPGEHEFHSAYAVPTQGLKPWTRIPLPTHLAPTDESNVRAPVWGGDAPPVRLR